MASYQTGVSDYVSQVQPSEPNLAFDAQVLQTKQTKYDANHKKVSQLYSSLLNSDMSRSENLTARDEFFKSINGDIRQMASLDYSLDSNVNSAANVFQSIYSNKNMVKDMVWTKNFRTELDKADSLKNCLDPEKCGGASWDEGDKFMQYKLQEYKNSSTSDAMNFSDVAYVPYNNIMEKALKYAKDADINITSDQLVGNYIVTTKNGPQAVGPLTELFNSVLGDNPALLEQFKVQSYVNRKDNLSQIMAEKNIDEPAALVEHFKQIGTSQQKQLGKMLNVASADEDYIKGRMGVLEKKLKTNKFGRESQVAKEYAQLQRLLPSAQNASEYIKMSKMASDNAGNPKYINMMGEQLDNSNAAILMNSEITNAAKVLSNRGAEQSVKADDFAKMRVQNSYNVSLEATKQAGRMDLLNRKAELDNSGNPFGGTKESQAVSNKTVQSYIESKNKDEIKGDFENKLIEAKQKQKIAKEGSGKDLVSIQKNIDVLEAKNNESILKKRAIRLDQSGQKPPFGNSFLTLYESDRAATGRTTEHYKNLNDKNVGSHNDEYHSKSLGTIYNGMTGRKSEYNDATAIKKNEASQNSKEFSSSHVNNDPSHRKSFDQQMSFISNNSVLNEDQTEYYQKISKPGYALTEKDKQNVATRINKTNASVNAKVKPETKTGGSTKITNESLAYVAKNHGDEEVRKTYRKLMDRGVENLSQQELANVTKRFNKLSTRTEDVYQKGLTSTSLEGAQTQYQEVMGHLYEDNFMATKSLNSKYLDAIKKDSPEYKQLQDFAVEYVEKHGSNTGIDKKYAGIKFTDGKVNDWGINYLVENDKYFSRALYNNKVKQKLTHNSEEFPFLAETATKKAMAYLDNNDEDLSNLVKLKKDSHGAISSKMYNFLEEDFDNRALKNGFLVGQEEFVNIYKRTLSPGDAKELYQEYRSAYSGAIDAVLTERITKNSKYKQSGVGGIVSPTFGSQNVHMYANSEAADEIKGFMNHFSEIDPSARTLTVKKGIREEVITDGKKIDALLSQVKRSKEFYNMNYQRNGLKNNKEYGGDKLTWEGLSLTNQKDGIEMILSTDPKVKPSYMNIQRSIPLKQKSLLMTGRTKIHGATDYNKDIYAVINPSGEIKIEGSLHIDGEDVPIQELLKDWDNMGTAQITDAEHATKIVEHFLQELK